MGNNLWSRREVLGFAGAAALSALPAIARVRAELTVRPASGSAYERAVLADRPVGYWRLGETEGSTAHDISGHRHDGCYIGRPRLGEPGALTGDPNRAVGLGGPQARSFVAVPDQRAFSVATSGRGLTVEVWMRPDELNFRGERPDPDHAYIHWLGKAEAGQVEWGFRFYSRDSARPNRISAYIWNADGAQGAGAYIQGQLVPCRWLHLVATFDDPREPDARVRLYKDGEPSPHNNSPGTLYRSYGVRPRHGRAPVRLGTRDLRSFLTGGLDEVAIYPRVLSAEEVRHHWRVAHGERR
jgi:hypothetical protein